MTTNEKRRFTVISNDYLEDNKYVKELERDEGAAKNGGHLIKEPPQNGSSPGFHSNPMYEKLLTYQALQKKKKFTVDDLLKW